MNENKNIFKMSKQLFPFELFYFFFLECFSMQKFLILFFLLVSHEENLIEKSFKNMKGLLTAINTLNLDI